MNKTQRIYVVSFAPSYDEGNGIGGFEWRRTRAEAITAFAALAEEDGSDLRLVVLDLPNDLTAEQIDDFLSSGHGCEIIDPPDPRTDLDGAIELWRGGEAASSEIDLDSASAASSETDLDSASIDEIIEAQGWDDNSLIDLLYAYIENQCAMDALRDFLARAAKEENEG